MLQKLKSWKRLKRLNGQSMSCVARKRDWSQNNNENYVKFDITN